MKLLISSLKLCIFRESKLSSLQSLIEETSEVKNEETIDSLLIQIATLTGLGHKRSLFRLSHALVDSDPKSAIAWYAVGCYYQTCGRFDLAQRYFCRATRLDPRNAECWIAFG